jgi:zinc D-Ala-D-Ala carboxypeptidase
MTQLSEHFTLAEMTATKTGLPNVASPAIIERLENTAAGMELVRALLGKAVVVHSGYRCPEVNAAVGGSKTSDHMNGDACDFVCPDFGSPLEVADAILSYGIKFDQLIREYGWVHISFGPRMRQQTLTKRSAAAPYESGINA